MKVYRLRFSVILVKATLSAGWKVIYPKCFRQPKTKSLSLPGIPRSNIVNIGKLISIRGNEQGYKLQVRGTEATVPASRSCISSFDEVMNRYHPFFMHQ